MLPNKRKQIYSFVGEKFHEKWERHIEREKHTNSMSLFAKAQSSNKHFFNRIKNDRHDVELFRQRKMRLASWNFMLVNGKLWRRKASKDSHPTVWFDMRQISLKLERANPFKFALTLETKQIVWSSILILNYDGSHHSMEENDCAVGFSFCERWIPIFLW